MCHSQISIERLEHLEQEHDACRAKLDALESALQIRADTRMVARELCFGIWSLLKAHINEEARLLASCQNPLSAKELTQLASDHEEELKELAVATWQLSENSSDLERARPTIARATVILRHHMAEQEFKLFPALSWVLSI
ncbi:MAG: hypothetical protein HYT88_03970 [Candidatus Omnitrophica bacterium]|nr:hypothetical protein [Candidatus Omnitrophota bacterium]MBI2173942.1 hypothetical protein [Candidatus Omnitrophota bacterium]MBI3010368.1 hypothetical protein [Candidatus Omnitrophota bacterium]